MTVRIINADCLTALPQLAAEGVRAHAVVCDPPYHLTSIVKRFGAAGAAPVKVGATGAYARASAGFMGQQWDGGDVSYRPETWAAVMACMRPGAFLCAFASTRGYHRMVCAIEDAGFVIHPMLAWINGSGFPKATRFQQPELEGWRYGLQALKPAIEPICLAQVPLDGTGSHNWAEHGCGGLNIDASRIGIDSAERGIVDSRSGAGDPVDGWGNIGKRDKGQTFKSHADGRWPANVLHDGSPEVLSAFPDAPGQQRTVGPQHGARDTVNCYGGYGPCPLTEPRGDAGSAARFFKSCNHSDADLLFWHAKAIFTQWNQYLADTADNVSSLSNEAVVSALNGAVTSASRGDIAMIPLSYQAHSTSVTPNELRRISEAAIIAILNIESGFSPGWLLERRTPSGCLVRLAEAAKPTGIIAITISHWKSSGFAEPVTFSITPANSAPGVVDSAASRRFHYTAKADAADRAGSKHPTVKPTSLMRWLVQLVTPPGGLVLDPFAGSGSTGLAADQLGMDAILIEQSAEYAADARRKIAGDAPLFSTVAAE